MCFHYNYWNQVTQINEKKNLNNEPSSILVFYSWKKLRKHSSLGKKIIETVVEGKKNLHKAEYKPMKRKEKNKRKETQNMKKTKNKPTSSLISASGFWILYMEKKIRTWCACDQALQLLRLKGAPDDLLHHSTFAFF